MGELIDTERAQVNDCKIDDVIKVDGKRPSNVIAEADTCNMTECAQELHNVIIDHLLRGGIIVYGGRQ